ncbi:MAG: hypothetical protein ABIS35_15945 [Terracoccus sp.]
MKISSTIARRRLVAAAAAAALLAPVTATLGSAPASATPFCGIAWGSLPKAATPMTTGSVLGVRSGPHACFDRLVVDIGPGTGTVGYSVGYVDTVTNPASGLPVPVSGGARLQVSVHAPATTRVPASGTAGYPGWQTFRQLRWVSSVEGYTDLGLGVRARLPMRAFTLVGPGGGQRLVVDVAHHW